MIIWKKNKNSNKSFTLPNFSKKRLRNFHIRNFLKKKLGGFTLVELLIVIVIIGIITSMIFVNLGQAKAKGRDAKRFQDMGEIIKALHLYWSDHGGYPAATCPCSNGGWETSDADPNQWLEFLQPYLGQKIPVDPINKRVGGFSFFGPRPGNYFYAYYKYGVPYAPCPEINHPFAIITISKLENAVPPNLPEDGMPLPEEINMPRARCGDPGPDGICTVAEYNAGQCRDWSQEFDYSVILVD